MTRLCHFPSLENFTFLHVYLAFFICSCSQVYHIQHYGVWADFAKCRVVLAVYLVYLSYLTLFSLCNYYRNKIFIISHRLTCFFSMKTLDTTSILLYGPSLLWAESIMGRVCYGPRSRYQRLTLCNRFF